MTTPRDLSEFLAEAELQDYYNSFINELKVSSVSQIKYVEDDDLADIGMSKPEVRRLKKFFRKECPQGAFGKIKKIFSTSSDGWGGGDRGSPNSERQIHKTGHIILLDTIALGKSLGEGEFGSVQQGVWTNEESEKVPVAVKCLHASRLQSGTADFLKEVAMMHTVQHEHIVQLYGVILDSDSPMMVSELAPLRSLLECLKEPALRNSFPVSTITEFALQVSQGMSYLEGKRLIHRDLAARNILVFSKDKVKISDFGLSRAIGVGNDYYQCNVSTNLKLPIAWCAPECINYLKFTSSSDVWAYGVTMWEMFTYGQQPWAELTANQILPAIDTPQCDRLSVPECCPQQHYNLMLRCWQHEPEHRPNFTDITRSLPQIKPEQVQTSGPSQPDSRTEFLHYRANDLITVLDKSCDSAPCSGLWRGVLEKNGHTGWFDPAHTTPYIEIKTVSPMLRAKSKISRKESTRKSMSKKQARNSRISADMIGRPQNDLRHTGHIGYDGAVFGDVAFIGSNYDKLPLKVGSGSECGSLPRGLDPSISQMSLASSTISASTLSHTSSQNTLTDVSSYHGTDADSIHQNARNSRSCDDLDDFDFGDFKMPDFSSDFSSSFDMGPSLMDEIMKTLSESTHTDAEPNTADTTLSNGNGTHDDGGTTPSNEEYPPSNGLSESPYDYSYPSNGTHVPSNGSCDPSNGDVTPTAEHAPASFTSGVWEKREDAQSNGARTNSSNYQTSEQRSTQFSSEQWSTDYRSSDSPSTDLSRNNGHCVGSAEEGGSHVEEDSIDAGYSSSWLSSLTSTSNTATLAVEEQMSISGSSAESSSSKNNVKNTSIDSVNSHQSKHTFNTTLEQSSTKQNTSNTSVHNGVTKPGEYTIYTYKEQDLTDLHETSDLTVVHTRSESIENKQSETTSNKRFSDISDDVPIMFRDDVPGDGVDTSSSSGRERSVERSRSKREGRRQRSLEHQQADVSAERTRNNNANIRKPNLGIGFGRAGRMSGTVAADDEEQETNPLRALRASQGRGAIPIRKPRPLSGDSDVTTYTDNIRKPSLPIAGFTRTSVVDLVPRAEFMSRLGGQDSASSSSSEISDARTGSTNSVDAPPSTSIHRMKGKPTSAPPPPPQTAPKPHLSPIQKPTSAPPPPPSAAPPPPPSTAPAKPSRLQDHSLQLDISKPNAPSVSQNVASSAEVNLVDPSIFCVKAVTFTGAELGLSDANDTFWTKKVNFEDFQYENDDIDIPAAFRYKTGESHSYEDLLEHALDGSDKSGDSSICDEIRVMRKVLTKDVTVEDCMCALEETGWDVQMAVKLLKLKQLLSAGVGDVSACKEAIVSQQWSVQQAANHLAAVQADSQEESPDCVDV